MSEDDRAIENYDALERGSTGVDGGRRRVLRLGGAALFVGSVGCTSRPDTADDSPSEPSMTVIDASVSDDRIATDEPLEVIATVENAGEREDTFYAELRVDGVIVDTEGVTVDAGETASVTFTYSFDEPGEYAVDVNETTAGTVLVERPPEFEVVEASMSDTTIAVGEPLEVTGTVENVGGRAGEVTAHLRVDGTVVDTTTEPIDAGETGSVTFTRSFDDPGEYELRVNDTSAGIVVVERPPEFEIVETSIADTRVLVGEDVDVAATVANVGGQEGTFTAELERDGETIATREVTVGAEQRESVQFSVSFEERGAYDLGVNGVEVDTIYVVECIVVADGTITVDSRSSRDYDYELKAGVDVTIEAVTQSGVAPTLTVVGPSGDPVIDGVTDDAIRESFTTAEAGHHGIRFENGSLLPWRTGTWAIEIEVCTW